MRRLFLLGWIASWPALLLLMLAPVSDGPAWVSDKFVHSTLYGAMTLTAVLASRRFTPFLWMVGVTILLSTAIEFAQGLTPWRHVDPADLVANLRGIGIATMIGLTWLMLGRGLGRAAGST